MKIHYKDILRFIDEKPPIDDLSNKLFQLGHEHEIEGEVFDLEFTPNRGDCLSAYGLARDLNVFYDVNNSIDIYEEDIEELELDFINKSEVDCPNISFLKIEIEGQISEYKDYLSSYFINLKIKKNNFFTDISNYISYELGQPTHCFDEGKINGQLVFDKQSLNEAFTTLMDSEIELEGENCIFSVNEEVISLAGLMGGMSTACSESTNIALIECAYFKPESIIGKSIKYNLQSDAAHKFERGVDPCCHEKVLRRFINIVQDHVKIKNLEIVKFNNTKFKSTEIEIDLDKVNTILGTLIKDDQYKDNLQKLGFKYDSKIGVPSYRSDVLNQNDLAEEMARIIGYNNIPNRTINIPNKNQAVISKKDYKLRHHLIKNGFFEVINFPFAGDKEKNSIAVDNPLDSNRKYLRTSLQTSLTENLLHNERRQKDSIKLFEFSDIYTLEKNSNKTKIGIISSGNMGHDHVNFSKQIDDKYLNSLMEGFLESSELKFKTISRENLNTKIKNKIYYIEFNIEDIKDNIDIELDASSIPDGFIKYEPISELPSSNRDFSFLINNFSNLEEIFTQFQNMNDEYLKDSFMFDFYKNEDRNELKIGYRMIFQSNSKTLSDKEIQKSISKILKPILAIDGISIPGME
tara:strand:+ start:222 stop:2123 length:1902 start_codon:yes stop_codon:yes gene_type:complete